MADRELRKMNRTELIEIIYALQVNERSLREENEKMRRQLDDKLLRIESAGSIAEAALSLNHIFEDAENAAGQYLESVQKAQEESERILEDAKKKADEMLFSAQLESDGAKARLEETQAECHALREQTEQEIARQRAAFVGEAARLLKKYPEIAAHMWEDPKKNEGDAAEMAVSDQSQKEKA